MRTPPVRDGQPEYSGNEAVLIGQNQSKGTMTRDKPWNKPDPRPVEKTPQPPSD